MLLNRCSSNCHSKKLQQEPQQLLNVSQWRSETPHSDGAVTGVKLLLEGRANVGMLAVVFPHTHTQVIMPEVPLTLINEDLTLGQDLRQLLLELPVLLGIGQRLHRSGADRTRRGDRKWVQWQQEKRTEGNDSGKEEQQEKSRKGSKAKWLAWKRQVLKMMFYVMYVYVQLSQSSCSVAVSMETSLCFYPRWDFFLSLSSYTVFSAP